MSPTEYIEQRKLEHLPPVVEDHYFSDYLREKVKSVSGLEAMKRSSGSID